MNISFKGMSRNGSEREVEDGNLAILINGTVRGGTIIGVQSPSELDVSIPANGKLLFVHTTSDETKNYIYSVGTSLYNGMTSITDLGSTINSVNVVGNTLIAFCDDGMHYFLWQDGTYNYIGQKPPDMNIQFGLRIGTLTSDEFTLNIPSNYGSGTEFEDNWISQITEQVTGYANKLIAKANEAGEFVFPFFIRYAYKLYDGTYIMHSAPVLMIPCSQINPVCKIYSNSQRYYDSTCNAILKAQVALLDYQIMSNVSGLSNWKDIISSVDIFISSPLYSYNEGDKMKYDEAQTDFGFSVGLPLSGSSSSYKKNAISYPATASGYSYCKFIKLPHYTTDQINDKVTSCSLFYLIKEIKIGSLVNDLTVMDLNDTILETIVTQEQMSDDYESHDNIIPSFSYVYNQRLNISGLRKMLFDGFDPTFTNCHNDGKTYSLAGGSYSGSREDRNITVTLTDNTNNSPTWAAFVFIKQNGKSYIVKATSSINMTNCGFFFYYPNDNAYQVIFSRYDGTTTSYIKVNLTKHTLLNGSYYFDSFSGNGILDGTSVSGENSPTPSENKIVEMLNKIYTSEVSNPFYFPIKGKNTVGSSEVLAIVSGTQPISQGQFGQFPLYAFTPEGIWALAVDDNGYYSSKQMASRDVLLDKDSICQIDGGVAYLTNQGLMLLVGGESTNMSSVLTGNPVTMDYLSEIFKYTKNSSDYILPIPAVNFLTYSSGAKIAYDYTNRRIVIYNPSYSYAYMYAINEKAWSLIESNYSYSVNNYPNCWVMTTGNKLLDLSSSNDYYSGNVRIGLLTRSMGFNDGDVLKAVQRLIMRGNIPQTDKLLLYGSRDLINWVPVKSSTSFRLRILGRSYKYFRLAYSASITNSNYVDGASVEFEEKFNNKIR